MIPDIDRKNLNFILYETSRFNVRAKEVPSQYKNYFAVELRWDENGEEKKKVCRYFTDYRLWWMSAVVHKTWLEDKKFWEVMDSRKKDDPDKSS